MRDEYDDDDRRPARSSRRQRDEDDQDDRPRRRRRDDSDDDWESRRGEKKGPNIVLLVAVVAVLGICVAVAVIAIIAATRNDEEEHAAVTRRTNPANSGFRNVSIGDMKQVSQAMQRYYEDKGEFPPAAMKTRDGKPGLSWRVALLPYMNQEDLYKQFKLDEPWDSPTNQRLVSRMPAAFGGGGGGQFGQMTQIKLVIGAGTIFDPEHPEMRKKESMKDGPGKTILFVQSMPPVSWTQPNDINIDQNGGPLRLSSGGSDTVMVALADGTVKSIRRDIDPGQLKTWLMPNSGKEKSGLGE